MDGPLTIPLAIETQRSNTVRIPVRNLVMSAGDDVQLAITAFEPDGTPADISGGAVTIAVVTAPDDPGGSGHGWGWGTGGGWDYGLGCFTQRDRIIYRALGEMTDPCCGQAVITLPRQVTSDWRGRYRIMVTLDCNCGGSVETLGVLDVRRGAMLPRLGTPGLVNISDAVVGPAGATGMGLLDAIGIEDGTSIPFVSARIGVLNTTPNTGPQQATFTVTLEEPVQQTAVVKWQTADGSATADGGDYTASEGTLVFLPGQTSQTVVVPVRPYSNKVRATEFYVHLCAGNGAIIIAADGTAVIPGWVGILDDVFVQDGTTAPFRPGLVGVKD